MKMRNPNKRISTAIIIIMLSTVLFMSACTEPPPASPTPPRTPGPAFQMIIERVQNLAQTYEAKEYVAILFPPLSKKSEYDVELRAWVITITAFPPEAREGFERAEWFDGDIDEHFLSFREPTWLVYDDGRIVPMGGAFMIEADIEQLNIDKKLPSQPPTPTPAPAPTPAPVPAPVPVPVPTPTKAAITVHLLAVLHSRYDSIADLPDSAKIRITGYSQDEEWMKKALATYGTTVVPIYLSGSDWNEALEMEVIDAVLVTTHPSYYLQESIESGKVLLLPWSSKAVTEVTEAYPETTVLARLPSNTYEGQTKSILGYAPAD